MFSRVRELAILSAAGLALALAFGATPALAIQAAGSPPDLVVGTVTSVHAHVVPETGVIVTDVQVVDALSSGGTGVTSFSMQGGEVGGKGMWTEQFTNLHVGDSVVAGVRENNEGATHAVQAPTTGVGVSDSTVPGLQSAVSAVAAGYIWDGIRWADGSLPVSFYVNPTGLPTGATTSIAAAAQTWENDPGSYMDYTYAGTTSLTSGVSDGVNVIGSGTLSDASTIAQCTYWYYTSSQQLAEFDITYNTGHCSFATNGSSSAYDIQGIGTHELGHTLHLLDLYDTENANEVMYGYGYAGETSQRALAWGDIAGIHAIYPVVGANYTLSGTVTGSGGSPLAGVTVNIGGTASGTTNASGYYSISGVTAGTYDVTFALTGYTPKTQSVNLTADTSLSVSLAQTVVTHTLSGTVTDAGGHPLAGVSVNVGGVASGSTNSSGYYSIPGVAAATYSVTFSLSGYNTQTQSANLTADSTLSVSLAATSAPRFTLSGTVIGSGGSPLAGVAVSVGGLASGVTNASGNYSISGIVGGTYNVTFSLSGYTSKTQSLSLSADSTLSVSLTAPIVTHTLSGTVTNSDGVPLAGASVNVGGIASGTTNAGGVYTISGVPAGSYTVTYSLSGYTAKTQTVNLASDSSVLVTLVAIAAPTYTLSGTARSSTGGTLSGVSVNVGAVASGVTDASGTYTISGIPAGTYSVTYALSGYASQTVSVNVSSSQSKDVSLVRTVVAFSGMVRDASGDVALAGVRVQVGAVAAGSTDVNGQFLIPNIPAGSYEVTYTLAGYSATSTVEVLTSSKTVSVMLQPAPVSFTGKVVNASGHPIAGAKVNVGGVAIAYTDAQGRFIVTGMSAGWHDVTYSAVDFISCVISTEFTTGLNPSGDVALARVTPSLSLAAAVKSVKRNVTLRVTGTLKPRHASGSASVRIYKWRLVSGRWKSYSYSTAHTADNGTHTTYSASLKFASAGSWRILAKFSADATHPKTLQSKYVYVTVK